MANQNFKRFLNMDVLHFLLMLSTLSTVIGCGGTPFSHIDTRLQGTWIREGDEFNGMIIEIQPQDRESFEAVLLWAPRRAQSDGFTIGDIKMRNIKFKTTGSHEYLAESLTRGQNTGNAYYSEGRLSMPDGDRIYWKDIAHTESIGTKQYWKRLVDGDPDMPLAWYGKAIAELQAERFSVALPLLVKISKSKLDNASVLNSVAWTLATSSEIKIRNPSASLVAAKRACELSENDNAMYLDTLAAAWAANGNFEQARKTQALAIEKLDAYDSDEKNATRKFLKQEFGVWGLEEGYKLHRQEFQEREELFSRGKAYIEE